MTDLKVELSISGLDSSLPEFIQTVEETGFDTVWTTSTGSDEFLPPPLVAEHSAGLEFGTRIALSFTRSPMVLAYKAWDLAEYSNGRFILGLGTQVKGHNERRFSVDWTAPNPRLREEIRALRHIFNVFQGEADALDFQGDHYSFSLMTDVFNPGPIDHPDVPIYIAAVNEQNLKLAGELCEGLALHTFNTPSFIEDVIHPTVTEGTEIGNRTLDDVTLSANPFVITGGTDEEMDHQRERVRKRIAFYASTRTYRPVLAHHGWEDKGPKLHELSTEDRWEEMAELITDEMVAEFAIEAPPAELGEVICRTYDDVADRVVLNYGGLRGDEAFWPTVIEDIRAF